MKLIFNPLTDPQILSFHSFPRFLSLTPPPPWFLVFWLVSSRSVPSSKKQKNDKSLETHRVTCEQMLCRARSYSQTPDRYFSARLQFHKTCIRLSPLLIFVRARSHQLWLRLEKFTNSSEREKGKKRKKNRKGNTSGGEAMNYYATRPCVIL